jgi:hypothetical protein
MSELSRFAQLALLRKPRLARDQLSTAYCVLFSQFFSPINTQRTSFLNELVGSSLV